MDTNSMFTSKSRTPTTDTGAGSDPVWPWYVVWSKIFNWPSLRTFEELVTAGGVSVWRGLLWVFIGACIYYVLVNLCWILNPQLMQASMEPIGMTVWHYVLVQVIGFGSLVFGIQTVARTMGGRGTYHQFGFACGAIYAVFNLWIGVLILLEVIFLSLFPDGVAGIFPLLILVLMAGSIIQIVRVNIWTIRAVNGFGTWRAILVSLAGSFLGSVTVFGLLTVLGFLSTLFVI